MVGGNFWGFISSESLWRVIVLVTICLVGNYTLTCTFLRDTRVVTLQRGSIWVIDDRVEWGSTYFQLKMSTQQCHHFYRIALSVVCFFFWVSCWLITILCSLLSPIVSFALSRIWHSSVAALIIYTKMKSAVIKADLRVYLSPFALPKWSVRVIHAGRWQAGEGSPSSIFTLAALGWLCRLPSQTKRWIFLNR